MERNFYNDDFEELLKEKADQYKMYPSDNVWNGIQNSLHSKRKWYWLGFALLLSGVSYYAIDALVAPPRKISGTEHKIVSAGQAQSEATATRPAAGIDPALVIPLQQHKPATRSSLVSRVEQPFYGVFTIDKSFTTVEPGATVKMVEQTRGGTVPGTSNSDRVASLAPVKLMSGFYEKIAVDNAGEHGEVADARASGAEAGSQLRFPVEGAPAAEDVQKISWLQQYALYEMLLPHLKRTSLQLSFAPTMNYRRLSTNRNPGSEFMAKNVPVAMNLGSDMNKIVNHKPALGFEVGAHLRYAADRAVTFKAGLQFNYARYAIEAFVAPATDLATITLNSVGGGFRRDSLVSYSSISNFGGNSVKDIQNQYFQISAPVGVELLLLGGRKLQLHIAGTVQPTYLINRNTYLITTDYQSYTREPSLVRRWNMNTSAEAFVSYNTGTVTWQVGPQFRYQLLSTYSSRYPIRENLMEYGVKIGVSKTIR